MGDFSIGNSAPKLPSKFKVLGPLGAGGMGAVYSCLHQELDVDLAIKVINPELSSDATLIERFEQEASLLAKLSHESVTKVYEAGVHAGVCYIAMEKARGRPLRHYLDAAGLRQRFFSPIRDALGEVHSGLTYLASQGVVHRDLKPENIMIQVSSGETKILDFGLSKLFEVKNGLTRTGQLLGTPAYMAPEQVQGKGVGPETDMFAYAVIVYEFLTGVSPFRRETVPDTLKAVLECRPLPVRSIVPGISEDLAGCLGQVLSTDPASRKEAFQQLSQALMEQGEVRASAFDQKRTIAVSSGGSRGPEKLMHRTIASPAVTQGPVTTASSRKKYLLGAVGLFALSLSVVLLANHRWSSTRSDSSPGKPSVLEGKQAAQQRPLSEADRLVDLMERERLKTGKASPEHLRTLLEMDLNASQRAKVAMALWFCEELRDKSESIRFAESALDSSSARAELRRIYGRTMYFNLGCMMIGDARTRDRGRQLLSRAACYGREKAARLSVDALLECGFLFDAEQALAKCEQRFGVSDWVKDTKIKILKQRLEQ